MRFDWDYANRAHMAEHDVLPSEAEEAFQNDPFDIEVQESDQDGYRYRQIGETSSGRVLTFLSTVRGDTVRIITAWDSPKVEKAFYLEQKASQSWKPEQ